jgi:hypothetical protein
MGNGLCVSVVDAAIATGTTHVAQHVNEVQRLVRASSHPSTIVAAKQIAKAKICKVFNLRCHKTPIACGVKHYISATSLMVINHQYDGLNTSSRRLTMLKFYGSWLSHASLRGPNHAAK